MAATYIRNDISNSAGNFSDPNVTWYAVGVGAMMKRQLSDSASWWYFAAIHGEKARANGWGKIDSPPNVPISPLPADRSMWNQCQHATWYFPPWHRGYLMALEKQLRADIVAAGGPATWALPYWNYFNQSRMPGEFAVTTLPANFPVVALRGQPNPLYVADRFGENGDRNINLVSDPSQNLSVDYVCLNDAAFTGSVAPEFGGGATSFNHLGGNDTGDLEADPHNNVHVLVGWQPKPGLPNSSLGFGLMTDPNYAALDPIFYLHHGMIDAMWAAWNQIGHNPNPNDPTASPSWIKGSTPQFSMPLPGGTTWKYTPGDVTDLGALDYTYDFLANPTMRVVPFNPWAGHVAISPVAARLKRLGAAPMAAAPAAAPGAPSAELVGASATNLPVTGTGLQVSVPLASAGRKNLVSSLVRASAATPPDKVILRLEGVRGSQPANLLHVFVNLPPGANPADHPGRKVKSLGLFGLAQASDKDDKHGGAGLSFALDITDQVDGQFLRDQLASGNIDVQIVPHRPLPAASDLVIGRISVHRVAQ